MRSLANQRKQVGGDGKVDRQVPTVARVKLMPVPNSSMTTFSSFDVAQWLPPEVQRVLFDAMQVRRLSDGQVVYFQNDEGDEMYRILSGSVRVTGMRSDGREVLYLILRGSDCFGVSSVIDGDPRPQTATAVGETTLQGIRRSELTRLRQQYPVVNDALLRLLSRQVRLMSDFFAESMLDELAGRLIQRILDAAEITGVVTDEGIEVAGKLSQSELASMIGVSRQSVNRALKTLQDQGLLSVRYGKLIIHDRERLRGLAEKGWRLRSFSV